MIRLDVNGQEHLVSADGVTTLLEVLRSQLRLTGAKRGCDYGVCGACTVLIDGKPARSCLALACNCEGRSITTVEALASGERLHPLQQALLDHGAVQCGFCTPGVLLAMKALLDAEPRPSREAIRAALAGNICRCTGYSAIVDAVASLAEVHRD